MIGWLQGIVRIRESATGSLVVDVHGVGYEVQVSLQTLAAVPEVGEAIALHVHTHVREDQLALFGFVDPRERELFRLLNSVPKVGPRNALAVLGGFPVAKLIECIDARDAKSLVKIPGIGAKTADQIILTLGDKMARLLATLTAPDAARPPAPAGEGERVDEVRRVLLSLGWKPKAIDKAIEPLAGAAAQRDLDELVRAALANLMSA